MDVSGWNSENNWEIVGDDLIVGNSDTVPVTNSNYLVPKGTYPNFITQEYKILKDSGLTVIGNIPAGNNGNRPEQPITLLKPSSFLRMNINVNSKVKITCKGTILQIRISTNFREMDTLNVSSGKWLISYISILPKLHRSES